jgi:hypothetical protein
VLVPKQVPLDTVRTCSWTIHTNRDTCFFGGRVSMSGSRDHGLYHIVPDAVADAASTNNTAKEDDGTTATALKHATLIVELVNHARLIAQIAHDPALETFAIAGGADPKGLSQVHLAGFVGGGCLAAPSTPRPCSMSAGRKAEEGGSAGKKSCATSKAKCGIEEVGPRRGGEGLPRVAARGGAVVPRAFSS